VAGQKFFQPPVQIFIQKNSHVRRGRGLSIPFP
jgi:hypothetical protein